MVQLSALGADVCRTGCRAGARGCKDDDRPVITPPPDNIALASLAPLATPQLINQFIPYSRITLSDGRSCSLSTTRHTLHYNLIFFYSLIACFVYFTCRSVCRKYERLGKAQFKCFFTIIFVLLGCTSTHPFLNVFLWSHQQNLKPLDSHQHSLLQNLLLDFIF